MIKKLSLFLKKRRVLSKNNSYSHISMGPPFGKFNIESCDLNEFYNIYSQCIGKTDLHIAEKSVNISPFIIDIDFLQMHSTRKYTFNDIIKITQISNTIIKQHYDVSDNELITIILEKNEPTLKNNNYKDGIHIIYPFLVTSKIMRKYLLNDIIDMAKSKLLFDNLDLLNDIEDIFDKMVISVPWLMLGSKKLNGNTYYISNILKNSIKIFPSHIPFMDMMKILSIHKFIGQQETKIKLNINWKNISFTHNENENENENENK